MFADGRFAGYAMLDAAAADRDAARAARARAAWARAASMATNKDDIFYAVTSATATTLTNDSDSIMVEVAKNGCESHTPQAVPVSPTPESTPERDREQQRDMLAQHADAITQIQLQLLDVQHSLDELRQASSGASGPANEDEKPQNLYSYTFEMVVNSHISFSESLPALAKLVFMSLLQTVLVYAFLNAGWLDVKQGNTNLLGGLISEASFYPGASIVMNGNAVPTINLLASFLGMLLLCIVMQDENHDTMRQMPPLVLLLYLYKEGRVQGSWYERAWQVFACLILQCAWAVRAIFVPVAAAVGTACELASVDSATDVVLNAVAVGFIFEVDEMLYVSMLTTAERRAYEEGPSRTPAHLRIGQRNERTVFLCSWLCIFVDLLFLTVDYVEATFQYSLVFWHSEMYQRVNLHCNCRMVIFGLLYVRSGLARIREASGKSDEVRCLLLGTGCIIASGFFAFHVMMQSTLAQWLASTMPDPGSPLADCLTRFTTNASCASNAVDQVSGVSESGVHHYAYHL